MDTIPIPQPTGNPLLDNPQLKAALTAQMQQPAQPQGAVMPAGGMAPPPSVNLPQPSLPPMTGAPSPTLSPVKAPRGTSAGDEAELSRKLQTGSGISQIAGKIEGSKLGQAHPTLGKVLGIGAQGLAQIGDIGLRALAPRIDAAIPGTSLHHLQDIRLDQGQLAQDVANEEKQAQTHNLESEPALHEAQLELAQNKENEIEQHHQQQIAQQLRTHGYKVDEEGKIQPLEYAEMSPEQQGVHDLKASQEELADARTALIKAQKDNIPAAQELARQRIANAQHNASIAAGRLGLSQREFLANFYGTDEKGNPLPGAPADQAGNPVGIKTAGITKPPAVAQGRASQGNAIIESANNLKDEIDKHSKVFGNIDSYWKQYVNGTPIADPEASKLMTELASFAALQPALHGFRSHDAMREFAKMIGGIPKNPEALKASIDGIVESAATPMIHAGTVRTVQPKGTQEIPIGKTKQPDGDYEKDGKKYHVAGGNVYAAQ